jgi:hypothetical protein
MVKKKTSFIQRKQKEDAVNKKAILWIGSVLIFIAVILSVLLILEV